MKYSLLIVLLILTSCALTTPGKIASLELEAQRNEQLYRDCVEGIEQVAKTVKYDSLIIKGEPVTILNTVVSKNDTVYSVQTVYVTDTLRVTEEKTKVVRVPDPTIKNENDLLLAQLENAKSQATKDMILFIVIGLIVGAVLTLAMRRR